ncbi:helix-turn-helix domain-containing protein [Spirosoma sp. BT704]|uniref:Helix-turn-helix domain-containing protein n=2 Tax=Spirosoma validum TaxID=2771355 RepID=A0A927B4W7_9BACT|nr:helix-turn-helix domain-containing protein [Spirosoma validum]
MKQPEGVMRQIVAQILLGQLNIDQAAERLKVNRQTVQRWMKKIEEEAEANQRTAPIDFEQPPPPPKPTRPAKPKTKSPVDELRAKVLTLEEQLEEANFKALYYSTLVRIAKHELGVDIEKKSVTKPSGSC